MQSSRGPTPKILASVSHFLSSIVPIFDLKNKDLAFIEDDPDAISYHSSS